MKTKVLVVVDDESIVDGRGIFLQLENIAIAGAFPEASTARRAA